MIIGVPKEVKDNEARVGVTPAGVKALAEAGHTVLVETQAGEQSGFPDKQLSGCGRGDRGRCRVRLGQIRDGGQGQGADR